VKKNFLQGTQIIPIHADPREIINTERAKSVRLFLVILW